MSQTIGSDTASLIGSTFMGLTFRFDVHWSDVVGVVLPIRKEVNAGDEVLASFAGVAPTIAVIMTGYQSDGSQGCRAVKMGGGRVLVQDPGTARAPAMPSNAIATGCADFVLPLDRLATAVLALTSGPGAADFLTVPLPPWARLTS